MLLPTGTTTLATAYLYSRWKDWVHTSDNSKYLQGFTTVGGDPLGGGVSITPYFFLINNWKIRPFSENGAIVLTGNLTTDDGSNPISYPTGGYNIDVTRQLALKTETVSGAGDPFGAILEGGLTREQALRIMLSALAGKVSGAAGTTVAIRDTTDSKDRIVSTVDADGNRTAVTLDGT